MISLGIDQQGRDREGLTDDPADKAHVQREL